jgi:hypothetical protein
MTLVVLVDALDRYFGRAGPAWVALLVVVIPFLTGPLWLDPWFGHEPWAPALATGAIRFHPAAIAISASGLNTMKDPVFYQTLGVHLEVRPIHWLWGTTAFIAVAAAGVFGAVKASRRLPLVMTVTG